MTKKLNTDTENLAKPLLTDVFNSHTELYGKKLEYKKGDVCIWNGMNKAIVTIGQDFKADFRADFRNHVLECAISTNEKYNSLHFTKLRLATDEEKELLGDLDFLAL
jgi:hypothetical protein